VEELETEDKIIGEKQIPAGKIGKVGKNESLIWGHE